ncbi:MAG: hypothetical protein ACYC96_06395 [Fimbriimonadaceae bacterium]
MIRVAAVLALVVILAGCAPKTSLVGTWTGRPGEFTFYATYNADGTFHSEIYNGNSSEPIARTKGMYQLNRQRLTLDEKTIWPVSRQNRQHQSTYRVTFAGDALTAIAGPGSGVGSMTLQRVDHPYHYVDHNRDVIGKWQDENGATLECRPDGTYFQEITMNGPAVGGTVKGTSKGTYGCGTSRMMLEGLATPLSGKNQGKPMPVSGFVDLVPDSSGSLRRPADFVRIK